MSAHQAELKAKVKGQQPAPEAELSYRQKFVQMDREALSTLIAAVVITLYFWLSIYFFKDSAVTLLSLPLWFMLSCVGGYLLSIAAVFVLVRRCMKNFSLN